MTAPRMAPLTPNSVMASGPMQQMLDATLVSAADEAPARALKFNAEVENVAIVLGYDKPVVATSSLINRLISHIGRFSIGTPAQPLDNLILKTLRENCVSGMPFKVVCVASDLKNSVRELGEGTRDQVVMVRIDDETTASLDDWVETGAVTSRSEGARYSFSL